MNLTGETTLFKRHRPGARRSNNQPPKTDMTPMVDLGFLLIAFFVMTTEMSKPATLRLNMPQDKNGPLSAIGKSSVLTVLLGKNNRIFYYEGSWEDAQKVDGIKETSLSRTNGLGKIIRDKQELLQRSGISKEGKDGLMVLIKAGPETNYRTVIDVLDETIIHAVKKYALIKPGGEELSYTGQQ